MNFTHGNRRLKPGAVDIEPFGRLDDVYLFPPFFGPERSTPSQTQACYSESPFDHFQGDISRPSAIQGMILNLIGSEGIVG